MDAGAALRAGRRLRRVSQRQLAELSGVPRQTVERIEAGTTPRVDTLDRLLRAIGLELAVQNQFGRQVEYRDVREVVVDRSGRHLPAHLPFDRVRALPAGDGWWGWYRIAWSHQDPAVPTWTYWYPSRRPKPVVGDPGPRWQICVWDDAT